MSDLDERREKFVTEVVQQLQDGFQVADAMPVLTKAMEYVGTYPNFSGADKKKEVLEILGLVLDKVDLPGPDVLLKPIVKALLPVVIDHLVDAAKGKFNFGN